MWRVVLLIVGALFVADTTGLLAEADEVECRDEPAGKQCPPTCPSCSCAWHSLTSTAPAAVSVEDVAFTTTLLELPPLAAVHGRLAPPPGRRPPIV